MNAVYLNAIAGHGSSLVTHIALVDAGGNEIAGGSYARQAVTWTAPSDGLVRPTADVSFEVPAGATVGGWRGYSAVTGGTNYGGKDLAQETFNNAGTYVLVASLTGINHTNAPA